MCCHVSSVCCYTCVCLFVCMCLGGYVSRLACVVDVFSVMLFGVYVVLCVQLMLLVFVLCCCLCVES